MVTFLRTLGFVMLLLFAIAFVYAISIVFGSLLEALILIGGTAFVILWVYLGITLASWK